jgi:hypothetical protein
LPIAVATDEQKMIAKARFGIVPPGLASWDVAFWGSASWAPAAASVAMVAA